MSAQNDKILSGIILGIVTKFLAKIKSENQLGPIDTSYVERKIIESIEEVNQHTENKSASPIIMP